MYTYRHYFYYFPFLYLNNFISTHELSFLLSVILLGRGKLSEGLRGVESFAGHNHTNKSI